MQDVIRHHLQTVLKILNNEDEDSTLGLRGSKLFHKIHKIGEVDMAAPEGENNKQEILMKIYFQSVLPDVVKLASNSTDHRSTYSLDGDNQKGVTATKESPQSDKSGTKQRAEDVRGASITAETSEGDPPRLADLEVGHDDIWYVLVFRMLCWLTLHDFHKKDLQMPNSELLGSRLPVFIA